MLCNLCPNNCNIDREKTVGLCRVNDKIKIAKYYLHPYEEPCISGKNGSGTIFFCGCSLSCVFCQNFELSRNIRGKEISVLELVQIFKKLEEMGAENINLVSPTHYIDKICEAFEVYKPSIPIVYNTSGYEKVSSLKKIDKYIDIYLPDMKYVSEEISLKYSGRRNYFEFASTSLEFMMNKPLIFNDNGMMKSGVIVRHLVLPQNVANTKQVLDWFAPYKDNAYINLMSQYTPFGKIDKFPELSRKITKREYQTVLDYALSLGIEKMFYQKQKSSSEEYIPKWDF